jgi:hypothetical protein
MTPDVDLLPPDLAERSLSRQTIILPPADIPAALDHLLAAGRRVTAWEGWVNLPDGGRTRSLAYPGAFVLPIDAERAAAAVREQVAETVARFARRPEYPGADLYVGLELG